MQARERGLLGIACALIAAITLALPAAAGATIRFASPTGDPATGDCTSQSAPCSLQRAVEVVAVNGDEVIVLPGTYTEGADDLVVTGSKHVHGAVGQVAPNLTFTNPAAQGVLLSGGSLVERLVITTDSSPAALRLTGGAAQQVFVLQRSGGSSACFIEGNALLRDSVCWANAATGVGLTGLADAQTITGTLRNVTVEATESPASGVVANADNGGVLQLEVKNTIARGTAPGVDVVAATLGVSSAAVVGLERSNYATQSEAGPGTEFVTDPGTNSNQTAAPALFDRAAGNFHQLSSSPTVDAGESFSLIGAVDIDGDPRVVEGTAGCLLGIARPDIGADEFVAGLRDCISPETGITKGPKGKTRKRRASFDFSSSEIASFQCSIDEKPFVPCASPRVYRLRPGKHGFNVRAMDLAGNLDPSPAKRVWRIRAKSKRKRRAGK